MAVAAIAASVVFTKARQAPDAPESEEHKVFEPESSLEALRAAGF